MPDLFASTLKVNPDRQVRHRRRGRQRRRVHLEPDGQPHLGHQPGDRRRPHGGRVGGRTVSAHDHHTIHRAAHPPRLEQRVRAAPEDRARRDRAVRNRRRLVRASSRATSTAADLEKLDLARVNPVTGPVYIDGAKPGDALKVTVLSFRPSGWGWTGNIPGFGLLTDQFPDARLHHWNYDPGLDARDVRARRARAAEADVRHDRRRAGRAGPAQHHPAAQRRRQHGRARHRRRRRALPADRGRRARSSRWATRTPRRATAKSAARRSKRAIDVGPQVRTGEGRRPALAALRHARSGEPPFRQEGLRGDHRHRPRPDGRRAHRRCPRWSNC